jgi:hypothetical protein
MSLEAENDGSCILHHAAWWLEHVAEYWVPIHWMVNAFVGFSFTLRKCMVQNAKCKNNLLPQYVQTSTGIHPASYEVYCVTLAIFLTLKRPRRKPDRALLSTKKFKECHTTLSFTGQTLQFLPFLLKESTQVLPGHAALCWAFDVIHETTKQMVSVCTALTQMQQRKETKKSLGVFKVLGCRAGWGRYRWCYQRDCSSSADTDRGVCNWPWQLLALVKGNRSLFVTRNWSIPAGNTISWSAAVLCACELTLLFSTVLFRVWFAMT